MVADEEEETSGHVHVVGALVFHMDTETNNKGQTNKNKNVRGFVGWDPDKVVPQGRPVPWNYCGSQPRASSSSHEANFVVEDNASEPEG